MTLKILLALSLALVPAVAVSDTAEAGKWRVAKYVPWYGPGFYGNRTACGQRMSRTLRGVAHRTLPCGTRIALKRSDGVIVRTKVVDRGPYPTSIPRRHMPLDLTARTMCWDMQRPWARYPKNGCHSLRNVKWRVIR